MLRLTAIAAALTFAMSGTAYASSCPLPSNVNAMATQIASGLNSSRRANGLNQLQFDRRLSSAAQSHACDMARHGLQGHTGTDGSTAKSRAARAGHDDCFVGESLAWGFREAERIVPLWMNSSGHRQVLLLNGVTKFGVGITEGPKGPNWVLVVARDC
ncbi:MAG: CAP domain-containing protein [Pseudomonadota bacterium]